MVAYTKGDAHLRIELRLVAPTNGLSMFTASFTLGFSGVLWGASYPKARPGFIQVLVACRSLGMRLRHGFLDQGGRKVLLGDFILFHLNSAFKKIRTVV